MDILKKFENGEISQTELINQAKKNPEIAAMLLKLKNSKDELSDAELELIAAAGTVLDMGGELKPNVVL